MSNTVENVAREAYEWFETTTRDDDTSYVRVKDGAPDWITSEIVYPAHGDLLPDDWRYACIASAVEWIADGGNVDVYTGSRLAWLSSHLSRVGYCDEAAEEFGAGETMDIVTMIGWGQYAEASEVFGIVARALEDIAGEREEGDEA